MVSPLSDAVVRTAALEWVGRKTLDGTRPITRDELANDFTVEGCRFPLIDRGRGIRKPLGWSAALSITTSVPKSGMAAYEDAAGPDGLHRYKLRQDQRGTSENEGLRVALRQELPLIWFVGVAPGCSTRSLPCTYLAKSRPSISLSLP